MAHERNRWLKARVQQMEQRLSEVMGEQVWRESGLGAATEIDASHAKSQASTSRSSS